MFGSSFFPGAFDTYSKPSENFLWQDQTQSRAKALTSSSTMSGRRRSPAEHVPAALSQVVQFPANLRYGFATMFLTSPAYSAPALQRLEIL